MKKSLPPLLRTPTTAFPMATALFDKLHAERAYVAGLQNPTPDSIRQAQQRQADARNKQIALSNEVPKLLPGESTCRFGPL